MKPSLRTLFNAWLKLQKKEQEIHKARKHILELATKIHSKSPYETVLIDHNGFVYRVSVESTGWYGSGYTVNKIADSSELPKQK